ncbi:VOC family protein [Streptomyces sp. NPDC059639]|uniref:VOC family protein n=1 Tax=Streptomyces sp. NPDC059639 TaxID=3346891 RepID=UPI0036C1AE9A
MPVGTLQCWACGADWATLHIDAARVLCFQRVTPYTPPSWPDPARPPHFHLDVQVSDLDEAQTEVVREGATLLDAETGGRTWRVFADPAGHPFCLVRHRSPS